MGSKHRPVGVAQALAVNEGRTADLSFANLTGAILLNTVGLSSSVGAALYNKNTDFTGTGFDPVLAGWTIIPEPSTALLLGLGLTALAIRRGGVMRSLLFSLAAVKKGISARLPESPFRGRARQGGFHHMLYELILEPSN